MTSTSPFPPQVFSILPFTLKFFFNNIFTHKHTPLAQLYLVLFFMYMCLWLNFCNWITYMVIPPWRILTLSIFPGGNCLYVYLGSPEYVRFPSSILTCQLVSPFRIYLSNNIFEISWVQPLCHTWRHYGFLTHEVCMPSLLWYLLSLVFHMYLLELENLQSVDFKKFQLFVIVFICYKKNPLWWEVRTTFISGY